MCPPGISRDSHADRPQKPDDEVGLAHLDQLLRRLAAEFANLHCQIPVAHSRFVMVDTSAIATRSRNPYGANGRKARPCSANRPMSPHKIVPSSCSPHHGPVKATLRVVRIFFLQVFALGCWFFQIALKRLRFNGYERRRTGERTMLSCEKKYTFEH